MLCQCLHREWLGRVCPNWQPAGAAGLPEMKTLPRRFAIPIYHLLDCGDGPGWTAF